MLLDILLSFFLTYIKWDPTHLYTCILILLEKNQDFLIILILLQNSVVLLCDCFPHNPILLYLDTYATKVRVLVCT